MSPGDDERRPGGGGVAIVVVDNTESIAQYADTSKDAGRYGRRGATGPRRCDHLTAGRVCLRCVAERREAQAALEAIAPVHSKVGTGRRVLIREAGGHSVAVDVDRRGYDVLDVLTVSASRWMKSPRGLAWLIPAADREVVQVALEQHGYLVEAVL